MAIQAAVVSVGTTPTRLDALDTGYVGGTAIAVAVPADGVTVYLGGSNVSTGAGFPLTAGTSIAVDLDGAEAIWAIVSSGTQSVNVLRQGI